MCALGGIPPIQHQEIWLVYLMVLRVFRINARISKNYELRIGNG
ncbi:hypothetical protein PLAN_100508 [Planktothrix rubescens CCAP 1459/22]|uniref:Uncharacterized protein n=1 Tax=Planktothrix rubescens CCAP 1459/22 TaxID=329571 RepID=A0A6J7ZFW3_PLARU|nr:hypothetical protein PLAN_100508 [Planktothrix rubescens NIVA-CYA 18]